MQEFLDPYMNFVDKESSKSLEFMKVVRIVRFKFLHMCYYFKEFRRHDRIGARELHYQEGEVPYEVAQGVV